MPRSPLRCAALLSLVLLPACSLWGDEGVDDHGTRPNPRDLTVRQSPGSTVRVGDTVTFAAVFKDSLNPTWQYSWRINTNSANAKGSEERTVQWVAPLVPGEYVSSLFMSDVSAKSRAQIYFTTIVLP